METLAGRLALRALARGSDVTCLDVAGAVQVLPGFLVQAVPLLQSGEVTEIIDGLGGFRAVMVIDCDSSGEHFDGLSVPAGCRQDASCPAQVSGQPDVPGPELFLRCGYHLLAAEDRSCRVACRQSIVGESAQLG